jgi:hypothetical protein
VGVWEKSESKNYIPFGDVVKNESLCYVWTTAAVAAAADGII